MRKLFIPIAIFLFVIILYLRSPYQETPYNYFTRLAQSFLNGKLYLSENPVWLNELVPVDNKYYVVYPPMPALMLVPYQLFFENNTSQTSFAIFLGSINVALVYLLLKRLQFSLKTALLVAIFFGFGTNHWYLAIVGSSWFFAHIVALFFLLLALLETFGKRRLLLVGLFLGASFWSRTTVIFTLPFFYILFWKKFWPINKYNIFNLLLFNLGVVFFIFLDFTYNFSRFGNFSPLIPYHLIPNLDKDPVFKDGFMSISFIPRHIEAILLKLPKFEDKFPFLIPSLHSSAIWFTSPALIYIFKAKNSLLVKASWIAILTTLSVIVLWAGVGYAQFGYRFAQDFMPFLLILTALGLGQKPTKLAYLLVGLSILVNFWGVIMINKFNIFTI